MKPETISSENLSKELVYLLGVYLSDGHIDKDNRFSLQVIDKDFAENTLACIKKIKPDCNAGVYKREPVSDWGTQTKYCIHPGFTKWADFFREQTSEKHHLPLIIWDAEKQKKKWLLAGILDGDGWISKSERKSGNYQYRVGIGGVREGWIWEFRELLHRLDVGTNNIERKGKDGGKPFISFTFKIDDFVEQKIFFTVKRKQQRVNQLRKLRNVQRLDVADLKRS